MAEATALAHYQRFFFALWPSPEALEALDALAGKMARLCGGRRTRRESLHMTLAFMGTVSAQRHDRLHAIASRIWSESFELTIDQLGYWSHNRIAWAGCSTVPTQLRRLYEVLEKNLLEEGFRLDERPFVPHITLVRRALCRGLPTLPAPIRWQVTEFALVATLMQPAEKQYVSLASWPLKLRI